MSNLADGFAAVMAAIARGLEPDPDMPFDQFTIEQLAGDLLPTPTQEQIVATAFHRNTMTQNEGGTSDEEFRNAAVIDRVNTTYAVFMGTTMACAQCHTHKYDPITIDEYFRSYAFLNQSADSDKRDESPLHEIYPPGVKAQRDQWTKDSAAAEAAFKKPDPAWLAGYDAWLAKGPKLTEKPLKAALDAPKEKRTKAQNKLLSDYYVRNVSPATKAERARMAQSEDVGDLIRYIACLPAHIVINEVMINPTWNRGYVANLQRSKA